MEFVHVHNFTNPMRPYIHDPFPTPFNDEILEKVIGNEA
jgi:hypothetical protein